LVLNWRKKGKNHGDISLTLPKAGWRKNMSQKTALKLDEE
jgi:hypothetical protein